LTGSFEGFDAVLFEMNISPEATYREHRHPGFVLGYIAEGATRFGVDYEPEEVVQTGETFFEPTGAVHSAFGSADGDEAARALLFMVVPQGVPLTAVEPALPIEQVRQSPMRGDSELPNIP
jgi:quercetin dioxygenase-like cupin family protein